jgi:hypothetical protein
MVWTPNQNGRYKASQKNMGRKNKHQKRKRKAPRVLERNSCQSYGKTRFKLERSTKASARQKKLVRICPQLNNLRSYKTSKINNEPLHQMVKGVLIIYIYIYMYVERDFRGAFLFVVVRLTFVRQRIKKLPESPFPHTYIYMYVERDFRGAFLFVVVRR